MAARPLHLRGGPASRPRWLATPRAPPRPRGGENRAGERVPPLFVLEPTGPVGQRTKRPFSCQPGRDRHGTLNSRYGTQVFYANLSYWDGIGWAAPRCSRPEDPRTEGHVRQPSEFVLVLPPPGTPRAGA